MSGSDLQKEFDKYVKIGNNLPPQGADSMLIAYSFFKQATEGDLIEPRPTESSNVVQTFKYDSWNRLQGMPKEEAMHRYISTIRDLKAKLDKEEEKRGA
jgi:diazepam-binding inhibitor (GABA receptor modulating acyl-CoA-binding protein)